MGHRIVFFSMIDDPFDPPGAGKFGGGQALSFELGRWLVRSGHDVTYVAHLNSPAKLKFEELGPNCRVYRIAAGAPEYIGGETLGLHLDELSETTIKTLNAVDRPDIIHAQYWVSGVVAQNWITRGRVKPPVFYHPLSFGRAKRGIGPHDNLAAKLREQWEPQVLQSADTIVVGSPEEQGLLEQHYPEVSADQILLAPLWYDDDVFQPRPEPANRFVRRAARRFTEGA